MKINIQLTSNEFAIMKSLFPSSLKEEEFNDTSHTKACDAKSEIANDGGFTASLDLKEAMVIELLPLLQGMYYLVKGMVATLKTMWEPFYKKWVNPAEDRYNSIIDFAGRHQPCGEQLIAMADKLLLERSEELSSEQCNELVAILNDYSLDLVEPIEKLIRQYDASHEMHNIVELRIKALTSETLINKFNKELEEVQNKIKD